MHIGKIYMPLIFILCMHVVTRAGQPWVTTDNNDLQNAVQPRDHLHSSFNKRFPATQTFKPLHNNTIKPSRWQTVKKMHNLLLLKQFLYWQQDLLCIMHNN